MYTLNKEYIYAKRITMQFIEQRGNFYVFKGANQEFMISIFNTQNIREPFKYIRL
jgi:hypothetical protein